MGQRLAIVSLYSEYEDYHLLILLKFFGGILNMSKTRPNYNEIIFSDEQERKIVNLYQNEDMSTVKIGKLFSCSHKKIARVLDSYGIQRTGVGRRKYKINEEFFDNIDTQDKAYILGFLYADGCNYMPKQTVSMSLQEDDFEILEKIRTCIGNERPLEYIDYSNKHDFGYTYKNQYRLLIFSKHICDSLNDVGMTPNKSLTLEFPEIDKDLYRHFIRGYFDGDGSIYRRYINENNKPITLTITSTLSFLQKIQQIISDELHIYAGIYDASNNNGITKVLSMTKESSKIFMDWLYLDANLYMQRKYDRYLKYFYNVA